MSQAYTDLAQREGVKIIRYQGEYRTEKNHRSEFALAPTLENRMRLKRQKFHEAFSLRLTI